MLFMDGISFCTKTANIWQLVGTFLLVFKIVIPIILTILGMFDLGKAVIAQDDKEVSKSAKRFAVRIVSALIIFFIPTIVGYVLSLVNSFNDEDIQSDLSACSKCISKPRGDECKKFAADAENNSFGK